MGASAFTQRNIPLRLAVFATTFILATIVGWGWAYGCAWVLSRKVAPAEP